MNAIRWFAVSCAVAFGAGASSQENQADKVLPADVQTALEKAETLEVYSLNGAANDLDKDVWHATKVLGKTSVKGDVAKNLAAALKKGVEEAGPTADCFTPQHGIRATYDGKAYDMLIGFECRWMYVYAGENDKPHKIAISENPKKLIEKILADAKMPRGK